MGPLIELRFEARGVEIWRIEKMSDCPRDEERIATCVDSDWAEIIAKQMNMEDVHCASCDGHACDDPDDGMF